MADFKATNEMENLVRLFLERNKYYGNALENSDGTINITLKPDSNDVIPVRNQIIEIDTVNSTTGAEVDTYAEGTANAGVGYTTTSATASVGSAYS